MRKWLLNSLIAKRWSFVFFDCQTEGIQKQLNLLLLLNFKLSATQNVLFISSGRKIGVTSFSFKFEHKEKPIKVASAFIKFDLINGIHPT